MIRAMMMILTVASVASTASARGTFNDVKRVLEDQDKSVLRDAQALSEFGVYQSGRLPQYAMNIQSVFQFGSTALENAAQRTINDKSDYLERLPKFLHPNGVCVVGTWEMNEGLPYTGAFAGGTKNLFIGRVSVAMQETTRGHGRGFGFAGKVFPTMNPDEVVDTENFFSVDVLMGTKVPRYLETSTTNEPEIGFDFWLIKLGLKIASALSKADENPGFRPVKNLASMGLAAGTAPKFPKWIRYKPAASVKNDQADFRAEVLQAVRDNHELVIQVDGSDTTKDRSASQGWKPLGRIHITEAMASYGCDRRLHFAHPRLK